MYASADNKRRRGLDFPEEDKSESPKAHSMPKNSDYHFFPNWISYLIKCWGPN